jgi:CheY-like chemotaxis protein
VSAFDAGEERACGGVVLVEGEHPVQKIERPRRLFRREGTFRRGEIRRNHPRRQGVLVGRRVVEIGGELLRDVADAGLGELCAQGLGHHPRPLRSFGGVPLQALFDQARQRFARRRASLQDGVESTLEDASEEGRGVRAGEGEDPTDEPVEDRPRAEDVGARGHVLTVDHLGGHVRRRAEDGARLGQRLHVHELRDAEVHQNREPVAREHDVLGLHVAVDDARLVGMVERLEQGHGEQRGDLRATQRVLVDEGAQRRPVDELRDDVRALGVGGREVEDLEDAGVVQAGDGLRLPFETLPGLGAGREVRMEHLQRHGAAERRVTRSVDHGHAPAADLPIDLVAPESLRRRRFHLVRLQPGHARRGRVRPVRLGNQGGPFGSGRTLGRRAGFTRRATRGIVSRNAGRWVSMADEKEKKNILVIEDEAHVRTLVSRLLEKNGYVVRTAEDGLDGLRALEVFRPDLIIADVMMPNLDGLTFTKALKNRRETKAIPVIFLTAKTDPLSMIEGINVGAKFYITKPFQIEDVLAKVKKVLTERGHRID